MRRTIAMVLAGFGTLLVVLGAGFGLLAGTPAARIPTWMAVLGTVSVLGLALWKLVQAPSGDGVAAAPWNEDGAIVEEPPESTPKTDPITGTALADIIETAASDAREDTVQTGLATVRAPLRETLVAALRHGGWDRDRIETALADGSWTDDPVAAAVLDESVVPPDRPLRRRVWAWLFPGKALRHRTARAVGAVARAADSSLPPVVGQRVPRPIPVVEPTLDDLQRAADGSLRRAVEGSAAVGAPEYEKGDPAADADDVDDAPADNPNPEETNGEARAPADGEDDGAGAVEWPTIQREDDD